jgi:very-short-patch-repair endonuclease
MTHSRRTIDADLARLAGEHNGLIRAFDLIGAGIARDIVTDRARLGVLTSLQPHVWLFGQATPTFEQQCQAAVWTSDGTLGGLSALVWHELVRVPLAGLQPTVVVGRGNRPIVRNAKIIRSASLCPEDRCTRRGLSVTSIPRTLLDSAPELSIDELERALDDALIAGKTTITEVKRRLDKAVYRSHVRNLRALVDERIPQNAAGGSRVANDTDDPPGVGYSRITRSRAEQGIKRLVLALDVPSPQFNYRIRTIDGGTLELDLAWPEYRVGLDIDGYRWHGGRRYWKRDIQRDHRIALSGWNVKRIVPESSSDDLLALINVLLSSSRG